MNDKEDLTAQPLNGDGSGTNTSDGYRILTLDDATANYFTTLTRGDDLETKIFPEEADDPKARRLAKKFLPHFAYELEGYMESNEPFPPPEKIQQMHSEYVGAHTEDARYAPFTLGNLYGAAKRDLARLVYFHRYDEILDKDERPIRNAHTVLKVLTPFASPTSPQPPVLSAK